MRFQEQSTLYEMVFSYGVCEQVRKLEIEVAPDIEAKISSKDNYCERDTVQVFNYCRMSRNCTPLFGQIQMVF